MVKLLIALGTCTLYRRAYIGFLVIGGIKGEIYEAYEGKLIWVSSV